MTSFTTLDQIYESARWNASQSLDMARDQVSGQRRLPSFLERLYANPPGLISEALGVHKNPELPEAQGSQISVSQQQAQESIDSTLRAIRTVLAQPGLDEFDRAELEMEAAHLTEAQWAEEHGPSVGWKGFLLKPLDLLARPLQLVYETGTWLGDTAYNLTQSEANRVYNISAGNVWATLRGDYAYNAADNPEFFGPEGMLFGSDILTHMGWDPEGTGEGGVDFSRPESIARAAGRFATTLGMDILFDPMARVGFGGSLVGAAGRGTTALSRIEAAISLGVARIAKNRGFPETLIEEALKGRTLAEAVARQPIFAAHGFTHNVQNLLEGHLDDVIREYDDSLVESLAKIDGLGIDVEAMSLAGASKVRQAQWEALDKLVGDTSAEALITNQMGEAVNRLIRTESASGPMDSLFMQATYGAAVRRRFFEMDPLFANLTKLSIREGGMPAWMAGGIRIGSISGRYGWFTVPGTRGLGGLIRENTFGAAWKAISQKFPRLGSLAKGLDYAFAKGLGRGHALTYTARQRRVATVFAIENAVVPAIDLMTRQAMARLNLATMKVAAVAAHEKLDFEVIEREITDYLTTPLRHEYDSGVRRFGDSKTMHGVAMHEAIVIASTYEQFLKKAREYNPDIGYISGYVPAITTPWWRKASMILGGSGIDIDISKGPGYQIVGDAVAATRVKTSYAKVGWASAMEERELGKAVIRLFPTGDDDALAMLIPAALGGVSAGEVLFAPTTSLNRLVGEALQDIIDNNPMLRLPKLGAREGIELADGRIVPRLFEENSASLIRNYVQSMGDAIKQWALVAEWEKVGAVILSKLGRGRGVKVQSVLAQVFAGDWDAVEFQKHLRAVLANDGQVRTVVQKMAKVNLGDGVVWEVWDQLLKHPLVIRAMERLKIALKAKKPMDEAAAHAAVKKQLMATFGWTDEIAGVMADLPDTDILEFAVALELGAHDLARQFNEGVDRALSMLDYRTRHKLLRSGQVRDALERQMRTIERSAATATARVQKSLLARMKALQKEGVALATQRTVRSKATRMPQALPERELGPSEWRSITMREDDYKQAAHYIWSKVEERRAVTLQTVNDEIARHVALRKLGVEVGFGDTLQTRIRETDLAIRMYKTGIRDINRELKHLRTERTTQYEIPRGVFTPTEEQVLYSGIRAELEGNAGHVAAVIEAIKQSRALRKQAELPEDIAYRLQPEKRLYPTDQVRTSGRVIELTEEKKAAQAAIAELEQQLDGLKDAIRYDTSQGRRLEWLLTMRQMLMSSSKHQETNASVWLDFANRWRLHASVEAAEEMVAIVEDAGGWKPWSGVYNGKNVTWTADQVGKEAENLLSQVFSTPNSAVGEQAFFKFPPLREQLEDAISKGNVTVVTERDLRAAGMMPAEAGPMNYEERVLGALDGPQAKAWVSAEEKRLAEAEFGSWESEAERLAAGAADVEAMRAARAGKKGPKPALIPRRTKSNAQVLRQAEVHEAERMAHVMGWLYSRWDHPALLAAMAPYRVFKKGNQTKLLKRWWLESKLTHAASPDGTPVEWTDEALAPLVEGGVTLQEAREVRDMMQSIMQDPMLDNPLVAELASGSKLLPSADVLIDTAIIGHWAGIAESRIREMEAFMWDVSVRPDAEGARPILASPLLLQGRTSGGDLSRLHYPPEAFKVDPNYPLEPSMGDRYFAAVSEFVGTFNGLILQPYRNSDGSWVLQMTRSTAHSRGLHNMNEETMRAAWKRIREGLPIPPGATTDEPFSLGGWRWLHVSDKNVEPELWRDFDPARFKHHSQDMNTLFGAHFHSDLSAAQEMVERSPEQYAVYEFEADVTRPKVYSGNRHKRPIPDGSPMKEWGPTDREVEEALLSYNAPWQSSWAEQEMYDDALAANLRHGTLGDDPNAFYGGVMGDVMTQERRLKTVPYNEWVSSNPEMYISEAAYLIAQRFDRLKIALLADPKLTVLQWALGQPDIAAALRRVLTGDSENLVGAFYQILEKEFVQGVGVGISGSTLGARQEIRKLWANTYVAALERDGYDGIAYWNAVEKPTEIGGKLPQWVEDETNLAMPSNMADKTIRDRTFAGLPKQKRAELESMLDEMRAAPADVAAVERMREFKRTLREERAKLPRSRELGSWSLIVSQRNRHTVRRAYEMVAGKPAEWTEVATLSLDDKQLDRAVTLLAGIARTERMSQMGHPEEWNWQPPSRWRWWQELGTDLSGGEAFTRAVYSDPVARRLLETIGQIEDTLDSYVDAYATARALREVGPEELADAEITTEIVQTVMKTSDDAIELTALWRRLRPIVNRAVSGEDRRGLWNALHTRNPKGKIVLTEDGAALKRLLRKNPDDWFRIRQQAEYLRVADDLSKMPEGYMFQDEVEKAFHLQMNNAHLLDPDTARSGVQRALRDAEADLSGKAGKRNLAATQVVHDFLEKFDALLEKYAVEQQADGTLNLSNATFVEVNGALADDVRELRALLRKARKAGVISEGQFQAARKAIAIKGNLTTVPVPGYSRPSQLGLGTGPLEGKLAIPEVILWFENYARVSQRMWHGAGLAAIGRTYKRWYAWFKTMVTVGNFMQFIPKNLQGGFWNMLMLNVRTVEYLKAAKLLHSWYKASRQAAHLPGTVGTVGRVGGKDVTIVTAGSMKLTPAWKKLSEVEQRTLQEAYDTGIFETFASTTFANAMAGQAPMTSMRGFLRSLKFWNRTEAAQVRAGVKLMGQSEDFMRLATFLRYYDDAVDNSGQFASAMSKVAHFDYTDLTNTEQWIKDHLIPFYVWGRRNLELQFRMAMERPEMLLRYYKIMWNLQDNFGGGEDKDKFLRPSYWGEFPVGTGLVLNGDTPFWARMFIAPDLPVEDLFDFTDMFEDGLSMPGFMAWFGNLLGPQVETPVSWLSDAARNDPYSVNAPIGLMQALKVTNMLGLTNVAESPQGDLQIPSQLRELYYTALPFVQPTLGNWVEPFTPTDPRMAARYGYVPGDRDWGDRFMAFLIKNMRGYGIKFTTPADTRGALNPLNQRLDALAERLNFQGLWQDIEQ